MKKQIIILLAAVQLAAAGKLTITIKESPYILDKSMTVDTLILEEQSQMIVKSGNSITVNKIFVSMGAYKNPNVIASGEEKPTQFDWPGIIIAGGGGAYLKNTRLENCIECIKADSDKISLDSVEILNFGQDQVLIGQKAVNSEKAGAFYYKPGRIAAYLAAGKAKAKKNMTPYYIGGGVAAAGLITAGAVFLLGMNESPPLPPDNTGEIKHPNLPEMQ
jgi:hypothetical protein